MEDGNQFIVYRSNVAMDGLSEPQKWEVTRRHPYYLLFWQPASLVNEDCSEAERAFRQAAQLLLLAINVTATPPPPPSKSAVELGITVQSGAWKDGAISRVTVRSLLLVMLRLPDQTKRKIADILLRSVDVDIRTPSEKSVAFLRDIAKGGDADFDPWLPELLVTINPGAPGRAAASAIEEIIRRHKQASGNQERRRRPAKIDDYLEVWDLREGWTGGGYDVSRQLRLKQVAERLKIPIATVENRYRSAFRWITGHKYSPPLWFQLLGIFKMQGFFGGDPSQISAKRPLEHRRPREVDATAHDGRRNSQEGRFTGILESHCRSFGNSEQAELLSDIRSLIHCGRTNEEIVRELELHSELAGQLVEYLRGRHDDGL